MKTIYKLFVLCCLMAAYNVQAKVITVSNRPGDIADFTSISDAIAAASDGDFIYVSGSATSYGNFTLNKRLTLIGSGHNPKNDNPLVSQLGSITMAVGSSSSEIIGFRISSITWASFFDPIEKVNIQRNNITSSISFNGFSKEWIIQENIIYSISSSSGVGFEENFIFRNNFIITTINNVRYSLFSNNVFYYSSSFMFFNTSNLTFINNIFYNNDLNSDFSNGRILSSTFNNNIFFGSNNPTSLPTQNNITGEANIFANPLFVNVPNPIPQFSFSYSHDFSLQGSSPGINAGTDGTDIGVFGGAGYSVTGEPPVPQVTKLNILNPIVPQNGNLNVRVEGKANN